MATRSDIVKDVKVIAKANVGSDHRLVVSKIKIDTSCERRRIVERRNYIDKDALDTFQRILATIFKEI